MSDTAAQVIAEGLEEMLDDHDWLPAANTVLAALAAAGYEIVKLPEPDEVDEEGWGSWMDGEVLSTVRVRVHLEDHRIGIDHARELAASLLAAARHAEVGQ